MYRSFTRTIAGATNRPVFTNVAEAIDLPLPIWLDAPTPDCAIQLEGRLRTAGCARFDIRGDTVPDEVVIPQVARLLDLGSAFTPPVYRGPHASTNIDARGLTRIGSSVDDAGTDNPAFTTAAGQSIHSDGTLQRIGEVPISILYCVRRATDGGATVVFHSVAAFFDLWNSDTAAAAALFEPVLRRTMRLPNRSGTIVDAAFACRGRRVISRYSDTSTERWELSSATDPSALERAVAYLRRRAVPGDPLYAQFEMEPGEGVILLNDEVAHGRTPYVDDPGSPRLLLRALFLKGIRA